MKNITIIAALIFVATSCFAGVTLSSPADGSTVGTSVHFVASASSSSSSISAIIIYVDSNEVARSLSGSLDQTVTIGAGGHNAVTKAWDNSGNVFSTSTTFTVSSSVTTSTSTGSLNISVSSPGAGATVSSPVHFLASASGAARMSVLLDGRDVWDSTSGTLDGWVSVANGSHTATWQAWDGSGNLSTKNVGFTVGTASSGTTSSTGSLSISISSPSAGANLSSPVHFLASASGAARMDVLLDGRDVWDSTSGTLDGWVSVAGGSHTATYQAWDSSGNLSSSSVNFSVGSASGGSSTTTTTTSGTTRYNMQNLSGWNSCSACAGAGGNGPVASYSMNQFQGSPSLTGSSTKFALNGGPAYADVLFYHSLIPDTADPSLNPSVTHFVYDTYFYINNGSVAQALEFDINQYVHGAQLIWGTQCDIRGGNVWDIYDNQAHAWVHTGIFCPTPSSNTWHHVIVEVERDPSDDWLHYIAITLDGTVHTVDAWYPPTTSSWNLSTINFQIDLDGSGDPYAVWLDKLNVTYW